MSLSGRTIARPGSAEASGEEVEIAVTDSGWGKPMPNFHACVVYLDLGFLKCVVQHRSFLGSRASKIR